MKIAVTSDLHGYLPEINPCDIVLIAGDISPLDIQRNHYEMEFWIRSKFAEWINNLPCDQVIMVAGNHDFYLQNIMNDEIAIYDSITKPTKGKLDILYNQMCVVTDKEAVMYNICGTPYCRQFKNWAFMDTPEKLKEYYSTMPDNCDIVLTHDAPKIGKLGTTTEGFNKGDYGNEILAKAIKEKSPRYVFCGHIHSGDHELKTYRGYGNTKFANVSYIDESYSPKYNILYLDI